MIINFFKRLILKLIVNSIALLIVSFMIKEITLSGFDSIIITVVLLAMVNTFIKPFLKILAFPINTVTFGLFTIIINAVLFYLVDYIYPGIKIDGFIAAIKGVVIISVINWIAGWFVKL